MANMCARKEAASEPVEKLCVLTRYHPDTADFQMLLASGAEEGTQIANEKEADAVLKSIEFLKGFKGATSRLMGDAMTTEDAFWSSSTRRRIGGRESKGSQTAEPFFGNRLRSRRNRPLSRLLSLSLAIKK